MFKIFEKYPELLIAFSQKKDGNMKITGNQEIDKETFFNRRNFLKKFGISNGSTIKVCLGHGSNIKKVSLWQAREIITGVDALVTDKKGVFLTITAADCPSVFLWDPKRKTIGLAHCGWRSLAENILGNLVGKMLDVFNSYPENLLLGIGPGIGSCHFEVKEDVLEEFKSYLNTIVIRRKKKYFLDLKKLACLQLKELGVKKENIEINPECTFCQKKYFSFRRDGQPNSMLAVFGMR